MRKRTHTTQRNHLIFYLATKEKQFATWRNRQWNTTKICFDALYGIFDFYHAKIKRRIDKFNQNNTGLKNPRVREQIQEFNALKSIWFHNKMKHIKIVSRNKRGKCMYSPNVHKDISFNSHLVSRFGTGQE